jgi:RimK family alpha-L-glutamate ligase
MSPLAQVAVLTDSPGWHGRRLARAFEKLGVQTRFASLSACRVDLEANRWGFVIPGFKTRLPDGVFVREIAAGSFQQVTLRLGLLHALSQWQVPVCNSARAIERSVDKAMTSMLLRQAGIATPCTWVTEQPAEARAVLLRETGRGHELVLKPLFGSQGKGLRRLAAGDELPAPEETAGVYYLQRFIAGAARDYRVFVIAGAAVAAMSRRGSGWVHNVAQGARCEAAPSDGPMGELAQRAVNAVGMDYAGVDLMLGDDGEAQVIEINGIPAWRGLQSVTDCDIAGLLAGAFVRRYLSRRASLAG